VSARAAVDPAPCPIALQPATASDDAILLAPWAAAFTAVCGEPVRLECGDAGAPQRIRFPRVFTPIELLGGSAHVQRTAALRDHVLGLGFAWDDDGRVTTVPAPGAFNAHLAARDPGAGFRIAYAAGTADAMALGPWLLRYLSGVITILVNVPAYYAGVLAAAEEVRAQARWGLLSVGHDLSVHALNYHLVPHVAVADLAARIRTALPDRYAAWADPAAMAPLTLTYFFDNDFNRYTYAVWCRCDRPSDFAPLFRAERNYAQLVAALATRIEETRRGRGDVPSGDFDEVGPLAPTTFAVE
jgi:hypothetical protein